MNSAAPAAAPAFSSWRREIGLNGMNALLSPMASMRVFDLAIASLPKPPEATVRPLRLLRNDSSFVSMQLLFWAVPPRDDRDRDGKINGRSGRQIDGEDRPAGSIDPRSETQFAAIAMDNVAGEPKSEAGPGIALDEIEEPFGQSTVQNIVEPGNSGGQTRSGCLSSCALMTP